MPLKNRITHLFDCADVGSNLVREAKRRGLSWGQIQGPWMRGGSPAARYRFFAELVASYPRTQLWHVHMGGRAKWARGKVERPYVLTLHGTDINKNYWQEQHHATLKADVDLAQHVFYTTPELREKAEKARADAEYMPQALNFEILPTWVPNAKPRVFFPSRWDAQKGGDGLLQTAKDVVAAVGPDVEVVGVNWGDRAEEAAQSGVHLLPRMNVQQYVEELSRAQVAIGQTAGILSVSELQAMAIGVPLIFPDPVEGYPTGSDMGALVVNRDQVADAAKKLLIDPLAASERLAGPDYVRRHHDAATMVPRLEEVYKQVLSGSPST